MKNVKTLLNTVVMTGLGLSLGLLTACGGGGGSKSDPVVSTIPNCTPNSIHHAETKKWTYSATDSRECKAIKTVSANVTCPANKVKVRIPITNNYNDYSGTSHNYSNNYSVNNSTDYHSTAGKYKETCMDQNSKEWYYIVHGGTYYYLNYSLAYSHYQNYQYQYQYNYQKQLSPKDTILTFGIVAAALFFLSN